VVPAEAEATVGNPADRGAVEKDQQPAATAKPSKTEIVVKYLDHKGEPTERLLQGGSRRGLRQTRSRVQETNASKIIE
jgi:hypothetical protein